MQVGPFVGEEAGIVRLWERGREGKEEDEGENVHFAGAGVDIHERIDDVCELGGGDIRYGEVAGVDIL